MRTLSRGFHLPVVSLDLISWMVYLLIDLPFAALAFFTAGSIQESLMWIALILSIGCIGMIDELNLRCSVTLEGLFEPTVLLALPGVILLITVFLTSDYLLLLGNVEVYHGIP